MAGPFQTGGTMAFRHGSLSFVVPLKGSGSGAGSFCCGAIASGPILGPLRAPAVHYLQLAEIWRCLGQPSQNQLQSGLGAWLSLFCGAIEGVWKWCLFVLLSGHRIRANSRASESSSSTYYLAEIWRCLGQPRRNQPQSGLWTWLPIFCFCSAIKGG